jgi:hypothetical protein
MKGFAEKVAAQRQEEMMRNFRYSDWRKQPVTYEKLEPRPKKHCTYCGNEMMLWSKACRNCHKKVAPCTDCGGPVGRETQGTVCWGCATGW